MLGLFTSPRKALVVAHDLLMTALAVLASFYIRFEAGGLMEREGVLFIFLPAFVVYAGIVYFFFHLYDSKWRFASLPDLVNILRASTVLAVSLLALDYVLVAPNVLGQFFFGKITIVLYWLLQMVFLGAGRIGYRYFRYTRTRHHSRSPESNPTLVLGRAADAEVLLRAIESGAVKKIWPVGILSPSAADRGQAIRGIPVLGDFDALDAVVNDLGQRDKTITRVIFTPSALEPDAKPEATLDARAPAGPDRGPAAVARRRRRSATPGAGQCRRPFAAPDRQDRLRAAGEFSQGPFDRGDGRWRLDRR